MGNTKNKKVAADGHGIVPKKKSVIFKQEFSGLTELKTIALGPKVRRLGIQAFSECTELETVSLSEGLQEIGAFCFAGCPKLRGLVIPDSVRQIGMLAFADCPGLEEPVYNRSGTVLYRYPDSLEADSFQVPFGVEKIASTAFMGNPYLKEVILPESLREIDTQAFCRSRIHTITIPAGVKEIAADSFDRCEYLQQVNLTESTEIKPNAFYKAPKNLRILRDGKPVRTNEAFWAQGKLFLRQDLCALPKNTAYTGDKIFKKLTRGCAQGDAGAMWELADYFEQMYREEKAPFFWRAETFWRFFSYLWGEPRADRWFAQWEEDYPNEGMTALLDERRTAQRIDGSYLYCLGFTWFMPGVFYDLLPTDRDGLTLVQSHPYNDKFFESSRFQITYLDEFLNKLPGAVIYRDPKYIGSLNAADPGMMAVREKAAQKVSLKNRERIKGYPYFRTPERIR